MSEILLVGFIIGFIYLPLLVFPTLIRIYRRPRGEWQSVEEWNAFRKSIGG